MNRYDFAISDELVQMVKCPTWITDYDSHSTAHLVAFPLLWNSDHVVVSVFIDFPSNSKAIAPSHFAAYDYFRVDWDGLCDHFRDVPWDDIFKLGASAVVAEFYECFWVGIDV